VSLCTCSGRGGHGHREGACPEHPAGRVEGRRSRSDARRGDDVFTPSSRQPAAYAAIESVQPQVALCISTASFSSGPSRPASPRSCEQGLLKLFRIRLHGLPGNRGETLSPARSTAISASIRGNQHPATDIVDRLAACMRLQPGKLICPLSAGVSTLDVPTCASTRTATTGSTYTDSALGPELRPIGVQRGWAERKAKTIRVRFSAAAGAKRWVATPLASRS